MLLLFYRSGEINDEEATDGGLPKGGDMMDSEVSSDSAVEKQERDEAPLMTIPMKLLREWLLAPKLLFSLETLTLARDAGAIPRRLRDQYKNELQQQSEISAKATKQTVMTRKVNNQRATDSKKMKMQEGEKIVKIEQEKVDKLIDKLMIDGAEKVPRISSESQATKKPPTAVVTLAPTKKNPVKIGTTVLPT